MNRRPVIDLAKLIHEAIGIDSPRIFILSFALFGALVCGSLGWLIDKGYRVSLRTAVSGPSELAAEKPTPSPVSPPKHRKPRVAHDDWLTDTQRNNITGLLKERGNDKGTIAIVHLGTPMPKYADQIYEAIKAAGWQISTFDLPSASLAGVGPLPVGECFLIGPKLDAPSFRAVADALALAHLAAPVDPNLPTLTPASRGIPDVTIAIKAKQP